jgi:hypothetical protein
MKHGVYFAAAGLLLGSSAAFASDGDDYAFKLLNVSKATATLFATEMPSGKWSRNWLSSPIGPGQSRALRFKAGDERCEVRTRVVFSDGSEFDTKIDYCGTETIKLTDDNLYVE